MDLFWIKSSDYYEPNLFYQNSLSLKVSKLSLTHASEKKFNKVSRNSFFCNTPNISANFSKNEHFPQSSKNVQITRNCKFSNEVPQTTV